MKHREPCCVCAHDAALRGEHYAAGRILASFLDLWKLCSLTELQKLGYIL